MKILAHKDRQKRVKIYFPSALLLGDRVPGPKCIAKQSKLFFVLVKVQNFKGVVGAGVF
jgi:hypothetical protein